MQNEKIKRIVDLAATLAMKAEDLDQVLIIYRYKQRVEGVEDNTLGTLDSELSLEQSLWLAEAFTFWLQAGAMGLLPKQDR